MTFFELEGLEGRPIDRRCRQVQQAVPHRHVLIDVTVVYTVACADEVSAIGLPEGGDNARRGYRPLRAERLAELLIRWWLPDTHSARDASRAGGERGRPSLAGGLQRGQAPATMVCARRRTDRLRKRISTAGEAEMD